MRLLNSFVINSEDHDALMKSDNYLLIHPNFDLWDDHLTRLSVQVNAKTIVKIVCRDTDKAVYTHDFFHLEELEIDSFDTAQGLESEIEESAAVIELRKLAKVFGQ
ncbi:hypothetical protein [Ruegeria arenilitoris]|uniref:hypothetical protein n=1 Tax=Ruegeria arenilitoris TaxID=1173585 RepID=UPI00147F080C|nr:hypothetical protein [Ruegeria arenilitoris]